VSVARRKAVFRVPPTNPFLRGPTVEHPHFHVAPRVLDVLAVETPLPTNQRKLDRVRILWLSKTSKCLSRRLNCGRSRMVACRFHDQFWPLAGLSTASFTEEGSESMRLMYAATAHRSWSFAQTPLANMPERRMPCLAAQKICDSVRSVPTTGNSGIGGNKMGPRLPKGLPGVP
jgi:hypothetical protein